MTDFREACWKKFAKNASRITDFGLSASVLGNGGSISLSSEREQAFFDIGTEIDTMLQNAQKKGKKILVGIDEVSKTIDMVRFTSEYGRWLRAGYPVYLVCTGLYGNMMEVSNVKNLTFFKRASTVKTESLNNVRMSEMYRRLLSVDSDEG